jgi:hypothetical protein
MLIPRRNRDDRDAEPEETTDSSLARRVLDMRTSVERLLRLGASDLTEREVELQELGREFMEREARLSAEESELNRRRSELGAVELKREAVEQRERALAAREEEAAAADARAAEAGPAEDTPPAETEAPVSLLFVAGSEYRLLEIAPTPLEPGSAIDLDGQTYVVARVRRAPLPADGRRCAYVEPSAGRSPESGGSS